jgi:hypothetical protein
VEKLKNTLDKMTTHVSWLLVAILGICLAPGSDGIEMVSLYSG